MANVNQSMILKVWKEWQTMLSKHLLYIMALSLIMKNNLIRCEEDVEEEEERVLMHSFCVKFARCFVKAAGSS